MKKNNFLLAIVIIMVVAAIVLRLTSKEDDWICDNGAWVRHGNPSAAQPETPCPGATTIDTSADRQAAPTTTPETNLVGNDRDEHGCIGSAGYAWCGLKEKCIRFWEEKCEALTASTTEITITQPLANEVIKSPLIVKGLAKGNWFFEANLPLKLIDENDGLILAHFGTAQSDWMTDQLVPFEGELRFTTTATSGYLLISKDNPSDLPQNDAAIRIPVKFK